MKRNIGLALLAVLCIFVFAGCQSSQRETGEPDVPSGWRVDMVSRDAAVPAPISDEDAAALELLLSSGGWTDALPDHAADVLLENSSGESYRYCSECGALGDVNGKRCLMLSGDDKAALDDMLRRYGRLYIDEVNAADVLLTEPPVLTVRSWDDSSIEAMRGTVSWLYDNGDGTRSGVAADSPHPLQCREDTPCLTLMPTVYSSKHPLAMLLSFDVPPDAVSVRCWGGEHWGEPDAQSSPAELYPGDREGEYTVIGHDGGYIYEVIAEWNSYERFGGKAHYSFFAEPAGYAVYPEMAYEFSAECIRTNGYVEGAVYPRVTVIDSAEELAQYYHDNKAMYDLERREKVYSDTTIGFLDACDKYSEDYFAGGQNLVLIALEEPSGSIRHEVTEVRAVQEGWQITVARAVPEVMNADMAEWHIFLEVQMGNVITKADDVSIVFSGG